MHDTTTEKNLPSTFILKVFSVTKLPTHILIIVQADREMKIVDIISLLLVCDCKK
jgi:hypothetical protein